MLEFKPAKDGSKDVYRDGILIGSLQWSREPRMVLRVRCLTLEDMEQCSEELKKELEPSDISEW